jgi:hypothetical protein
VRDCDGPSGARLERVNVVRIEMLPIVPPAAVKSGNRGVAGLTAVRGSEAGGSEAGGDIDGFVSLLNGILAKSATPSRYGLHPSPPGAGPGVSSMPVKGKGNAKDKGKGVANGKATNSKKDGSKTHPVVSSQLMPEPMPILEKSPILRAPGFDNTAEYLMAAFASDRREVSTRPEFQAAAGDASAARPLLPLVPLLPMAPLQPERTIAFGLRLTDRSAERASAPQLSPPTLAAKADSVTQIPSLVAENGNAMPSALPIRPTSAGGNLEAKGISSHTSLPANETPSSAAPDGALVSVPDPSDPAGVQIRNPVLAEGASSMRQNPVEASVPVDPARDPATLDSGAGAPSNVALPDQSRILPFSIDDKPVQRTESEPAEGTLEAKRTEAPSAVGREAVPPATRNFPAEMTPIPAAASKREAPRNTTKPTPDAENSEPDPKAANAPVDKKPASPQGGQSGMHPQQNPAVLGIEPRRGDGSGMPGGRLQRAADDTAQPDVDAARRDVEAAQLQNAATDIQPNPGLRPQAMQQVSLRLASPDAPSVNVQLTERDGKVQVAVRTEDPELARSMQADLGDLVGRLEEKGFKAESWVPGAAHPAAPAAAQHSNSADNQGQPEHSGGGAGREQQRHEQNGSSHRQRARWMMQFDETLSAENTTSEAQSGAAPPATPILPRRQP